MSGCCVLLGTGEPGSCPVCGEQGTPVERETLEPLLKPAPLQDAALAAVKHNQTPVAQVVSRLAAQGVAVYVAQQDLALRGISPDDLTPGATAVDDRRLADLMLADGTKTLGCF